MFLVFSLILLSSSSILVQATQKLINKKMSFVLKKKKLTYLFYDNNYFSAGAKYFLVNSIEIAERSNLIFPAPVSIVTVLSVVLISTIFP